MQSRKMTDQQQRMQPPTERVNSASREAYELALDSLHDVALQEALFRRLDKEIGEMHDDDDDDDDDDGSSCR